MRLTIWIMPFNQASVLSVSQKFCGRNGRVMPIWRILPSAKGTLKSRFCSLKSSTDATAWRKKNEVEMTEPCDSAAYECALEDSKNRIYTYLSFQ